MRVCVLCEESKLDEVRRKLNRFEILSIECSESGKYPSTHRFCCIATDELGAQELLNRADITIIEKSSPREFLNKYHLKIIKEK